VSCFSCLVSQSRVAVTEVLRQFRNQEERECRPLEAVTRGLLQTVTEDTCACVCVRACVCARACVCERER
jgi:hypothetical protein